MQEVLQYLALRQDLSMAAGREIKKQEAL